MYRRLSNLRRAEAPNRLIAIERLLTEHPQVGQPTVHFREAMSSNQFTRREFVKVPGAAALAHSIPAVAQRSSKKTSDLLLYVGTYTNGKSEGIYVYRMNPDGGELKHAATVKGVSNPSFLAIDPKRRFLYAANESGEFAGKKGGGVTAFAIDRKTGDLRKLKEREAGPERFRRDEVRRGAAPFRFSSFGQIRVRHQRTQFDLDRVRLR